MIAAPPPAPPAIIMTYLALNPDAAYLGVDLSAREEVNTPMLMRSRPERSERTWSTGYQLGPKTRGARDASRRSRSRRRKARG